MKSRSFGVQSLRIEVCWIRGPRFRDGFQAEASPRGFRV